MTRLQISYTLTFTAPFHMGTGISAGLLDRTVIRKAQGYLYVPASTFKGVLREHCEQLSRFYLPTIHVPSPHVTAAALNEFESEPTLLSRIFGSQLSAGGLHFENATQSPDDLDMYQVGGGREYKEAQVDIATQVRIDRHTRTAVDRALYSSEFGIRELSFMGTIKGQLMCMPIDSLTSMITLDEETYTITPTYSLLLLLAGLLLIERLGGNKSTGKGQCNCTIREVLIDRRPCPQASWENWVKHLDLLSNYPHPESGGQV